MDQRKASAVGGGKKCSPIVKSTRANPKAWSEKVVEKQKFKEMKALETRLREEKFAVLKKKRKNQAKKDAKVKEKQILQGVQIIKDPARTKKWHKNARAQLQKMSPQMMENLLKKKASGRR